MALFIAPSAINVSIRRPLFPSLRALSLISVRMSTFPDVLTLLGLTSLCCQPYSGAQFSRLPPSLSNLAELKSLSLLSMQRLSLDVDIILALPALTSLHISDCKKLSARGMRNPIFGFAQALQRHPKLVDINMQG